MNLLRAFMQALTFSGAGFIYILPLRKRSHWPVWTPVALALLSVIFALCTPNTLSWLCLSYPLTYVVLLLMVRFATKMSLSGACYCAVWTLITGEILLEIYQACYLLLFPEAASFAETIAICVVTGILLCFLLSRTLARSMPQKDVYQIGPRQMSSAFVLAILFMTGAYLLMLPDKSRASVILILFCQFYCVSLLYVQTELFKKSRMQKDLNAMNFLYDREQQQYASAKRNVGIVSRKCSELEQQIAAMQQYLPEDLRGHGEKMVDDALRSCDVMVHSGNDALDIVLTEKKLLAEHHGVEIDCVADGSLLNFMEPVDIYALFSCALDNAIESVKKYPESSGMLIDILIHSAQNFLVISITSSLQDAPEKAVLKRWAGLRGYGLEMVHMTVEKYRGMLSIDSQPHSVTLKILIPLVSS